MPSITFETLASLPGIGCELRMTVSSGPILIQRLSLDAISDSADIGSPCEPVEITHTRDGSRSATSSMSTNLLSGTCNSPISRARRTFFFIDMPSVATVRSKASAASMICCTRWMWLAKQAMTMRRPSWAWNRS